MEQYLKSNFPDNGNRKRRVPERFKLSEVVLKRIRDSRPRNLNFDPSQIVKLEDAPAILTMELNVELGLTPVKLLKIARSLDPRTVIDLEGQYYVDIVLLQKGLIAYIKKQRDKKILRISRSSRAAMHRNIILLKALEEFEEILKLDLTKQQKITESINSLFGEDYKALKDGDLLAFLKNYRINAEKRRIRSEEAEYELLALEELDL